MRRTGFTLMELLVVVAIITMLIGILLPALNKGRAAGQYAVCMANMHQVDLGFIMYSQNNRQYLPFHADLSGEHMEDWIYWQPDRDPMKSAIAKYVGGFNANLLHCPTDNVAVRARYPMFTYPYRYSYTFNLLFASNGSGNPPRLPFVSVPARKYVLIDEDQLSLDDGNFHPLLVGNPYENFLGTRHDDNKQNHKSRGNVAMADGHIDFLTVDDIQSSDYYDPWSP